MKLIIIIVEILRASRFLSKCMRMFVRVFWVNILKVLFWFHLLFERYLGMKPESYLLYPKALFLCVHGENGDVELGGTAIQKPL